MIQVAIVSPSYNEEAIIGTFIDAFQQFRASEAGKADYRLYIVDDGSFDGTCREIERKKAELQLDDLTLIRLAGNFGHQSALVAGLAGVEACDLVISMDSDLEHPFRVIPELIEAWRMGYLVVNTCRLRDKRTPLAKRILSSLFYKTIHLLTSLEIVEGSADFRAVDYQLVKSCQPYLQNILSLRLFFAWIPVRKHYVPYAPDINDQRVTRFTFAKNLRLAFDSIIQFSERPFHIFLGLGTIAVVLGVGYGGYVVTQKMLGVAVPGWASVIVLLIITGSILIVGTGILGLYIRRIQFAGTLPRFLILDPLKKGS